MRRIFNPTHDEKWWRIRYNAVREMCYLYNDMKVTVCEIQKIAVGRARNQNGGASYTKESAATNNPLQETGRKTQKKKGRWSERECHHVTWYTSLEKQSQRRRILEATHSGG